MESDKYLIADLLHENEVNFAKFEKLKHLKGDILKTFFKLIYDVSELIDDDNHDKYLVAICKLHQVLFNVIKITYQQNHLLNDVKLNLKEIERIRQNGADKKAN